MTFIIESGVLAILITIAVIINIKAIREYRTWDDTEL
jgi:hypothetical protein